MHHIEIDDDLVIQIMIMLMRNLLWYDDPGFTSFDEQSND